MKFQMWHWYTPWNKKKLQGCGDGQFMRCYGSSLTNVRPEFQLKAWEPETVDFSKIYIETGRNWTRGAGINI
jgi:hypothetical protein